MTEAEALEAIKEYGPPTVKENDLVLCISPTRGFQLARGQKDSYSGNLVLVRIGGPENLIEESPDVLMDAKPFICADGFMNFIGSLLVELANCKRMLRLAHQQSIELEAKIAAFKKELH